MTVRIWVTLLHAVGSSPSLVGPEPSRSSSSSSIVLDSMMQQAEQGGLLQRLPQLLTAAACRLQSPPPDTMDQSHSEGCLEHSEATIVVLDVSLVNHAGRLLLLLCGFRVAWPQHAFESRPGAGECLAAEMHLQLAALQYSSRCIELLQLPPDTPPPESVDFLLTTALRGDSFRPLWHQIMLPGSDLDSDASGSRFITIPPTFPEAAQQSKYPVLYMSAFYTHLLYLPLLQQQGMPGMSEAAAAAGAGGSAAAAPAAAAPTAGVSVTAAAAAEGGGQPKNKKASHNSSSKSRQNSSSSSSSGK